MNRILQTLTSTLKARITPIWTKIKRWMTPSFIITKLTTWLRKFFTQILNVRPRDEKDYFKIFSWLVSRKLVYAAVIVLGVLSVWYIVSVRGTFSSDTEKVRSYAYNSPILKFTSDTVKIKAKSGYVAYEGEVEDGEVTGNGSLYNADGVLIYQGAFEQNKYEGSGSLYYDTGDLKYVGDFSDNQFEGAGKLYYEDGTLAYEGDFSSDAYNGQGLLYRQDGLPAYEGTFSFGLFDGSGSLYGTEGNVVYTGTFSKGEIIYRELLGETATQISQSYQGDQDVYVDLTDDTFVVYLRDIGVIYADRGDDTESDEEICADCLVILRDDFPTGEESLTGIGSLNRYFGSIGLRRQVSLDLEQTVALLLTGDTANGSKLKLLSGYDEYNVVKKYKGFANAYTYQKDGISYTFYVPDGEQTFAFYTMEKIGNEDETVGEVQEEAQTDATDSTGTADTTDSEDVANADGLAQTEDTNGDESVEESAEFTGSQEAKG